MDFNNDTLKINFELDKESEVHEIIALVYDALRVKGYDPISQIVGYILSDDPTYITSYNGARSLIVKVERDELLEELVKNYIKTRNLSLEDFVKSNERAANSMNMIISNISKLTGYQEELIADVLINDIEQ